MTEKRSKGVFFMKTIRFGKRLFPVLLVALAVLLTACVQPDPISQTQKLSPNQGAPDSVVRDFLNSFAQNELKAYTDYTYTVDHDVELISRNGQQYITDAAHIAIVANDEYYTYRYAYDVIFVRETLSNDWGISTYSFTVPEKERKESQASTPVNDDPSSVTTPTDPPAEQTAPAKETTPPSTPVPDFFTFGGVTIERGTTVIKGDVEINGIKIDGDSKGNFTHITKEEVETLVKMCPDLEILHLDYCWMDTYEPLSQLKNLEDLRLMSCGTDNGGVPITDIEWIRPLVNLKKLYLCHNKISNIEPIKNLTKLTELNLGDNLLDDDDLDIIANFKQLDELYLYRNNFSDVSILANLNNVTVLNLATNPNIKSVRALTSMKSLTDLRIYSTGVNDLSYFPKFKKLKKVNLAYCPLSFWDYYEYLPQCQYLKKFLVSKNDTEGIDAGDAILRSGYDLDYEIYD